MAAKLTTMATQAHQDPGMRQLLAQLSGQRVIAFNVNLARVCGDVKAALFASQLLYWTRVGPEVQTNGGWVFKTREQWQTETGLTRFEQESARKRLQGLALIEQARVGAPPMSCFRIVLPELGKALSSLLNQPQPQQQWSLFALRSSEAHIRQLLGRNMAYYNVFAQITDSMPAAVLLTKALALHTMVLQKSKAQAGAEWFSLTAQQWQDETGLRAAQLRLAKQKLCQLSILQEALQTYPLRRTYWRVDIAVVSRLLTTQLSATSTNLFGRILAMAQSASELKDRQVVVPGCVMEQNIPLYPRETLTRYVPLGTRYPLTRNVPPHSINLSSHALLRDVVGNNYPVCPWDTVGNNYPLYPRGTVGNNYPPVFLKSRLIIRLVLALIPPVFRIRQIQTVTFLTSNGQFQHIRRLL